MDILDFFRKVTGLIPTKDQESLLLDLCDISKKKIIISAGRQSGKTLCSAVATLWWVFESGMKVKILLISAQDNILYYHIREIFKNNLQFEPQIVAQGTYSIVPLRGFELTNGNQVFVRGSTDKQVRGIPADIVIIDEAADINNDIVLTALGNLSGNISKICMVSTPHILTSIFVKWASDLKSGFDIHQWSSEGLPWHDLTIDKLKKKEYAPSKYAIEMLGRVPSITEISFFSKKDIEKCIIENIQPETTEKRIAGLDFGESVGEHVLSIIEQVGVRRRLLFIKAWKKTPIESILPDIQRYCENYKVEIIRADSKPSEYAKIIGDKIGSIPIIYLDMTYHKKAMLGQWRLLIKRHNFQFDAKEIPLKLQIERYRLHKRAGDDLCDSCMMSCYDWKYKPKPKPMVVF